MSYEITKRKIIKKAIEDTIQYENMNLKSNMGIWLSFKTNLFNAKNTLTYNIVNRGTNFDYFSFNYVNIFNSSFYLKNEEGKKKFNEKIDKILKKTNSIKDSLKSTIYFFLDNPLNEKDLPLYLNDYYQKIKSELNLNDQIKKKIFSPFSIRNICNIGEIVEKTCGEWFSDVKLPIILDIINTNMNVILKLKILNFTSNIIFKNILEKCFKKLNSIVTIGIDNLEMININNEQYLLENYGLIFVSVRLGIYNISEEYFEPMKNIFSCKQFLGFVGGKNNAASYIIGYNEKNMIYLDPHYSQESIIPPIDDNNIKSYLNKAIYQILLENLQPAFTMAFLFTNIQEFNDLISYFQAHNNFKYPCFSFQIDSIFKKINNNSFMNDNNNSDDF